MPTPTVTRTLSASAHVAVAIRVGDPEREAIARRNLAEARIADAIDKALAESPLDLTPTQIKTLTGMLRRGGQR